jgi:hypothetical protein
LILGAAKVVSQNAGLEYSKATAVNLTEMAQKMAQAARAVAIEKRRLQEILAERQKKSASPSG